MPERNYPQYPMMDNPVTKKVLYKVGLITRESGLQGSDGEKRPLAERSDRAELFKEVKKIRKKENLKTREKYFDRASVFFNKAHELDKAFVQFLRNQQEVKVNMNEFGEQMARYVILEPSKPSDKPPIILLPGISNDLEGIGELPIRLAASGRKVIEIAYPESWHGKVTKEFGDAVKKSEKFETHTAFFREAILKIAGEYTQVDLLGVSTGAIICANLLNDWEFKKRVDNAALIVPPGEINHKNFNISLFKETITEAKKFWLNSKLSVVNKKIINTSDEHRKLMLHTHNALKEKVLSEYKWWSGGLKTGTEKRTVVIIGDHDHITEAIKAEEKIIKNKTIKLHCIKDGNHGTPSVEADKVIGILNHYQR